MNEDIYKFDYVKIPTENIKEFKRTFESWNGTPKTTIIFEGEPTFGKEREEHLGQEYNTENSKVLIGGNEISLVATNTIFSEKPRKVKRRK